MFAGTERIRVGGRALAFQHQHREALRARARKSLCELPKRNRARLGGWDQPRLAHRDELDEHAGKLNDAIVRAPWMLVARAHREAERRIALAHSIEVVHRMNDVIEPAWNGALHDRLAIRARNGTNTRI